jgi:hypothetical protein
LTLLPIDYAIRCHLSPMTADTLPFSPLPPCHYAAAAAIITLPLIISFRRRR